MAARETAAQRKTRIGMLLADYDNRSKQLRKDIKIVDGLKEQIRDIPGGKYGDWELSEGTPREILDQAAVKREFATRGIPLPMAMTSAPIVVKPVTK